MKDITGRGFGWLHVLWPIARHKNRQVIWACQCKCGTVLWVRGGDLRNGHTTSCGCLSTVLRFKHGMAATPEYRAFHDARNRCQNNKIAFFNCYGGRGIEFRFASFREFYKELGPRPEGKSFDRINNDGHYEPGNVRWATPLEQTLNRRNLKEASSATV